MLKESDISWNDYLVLKLYVTAKRRNRLHWEGKELKRLKKQLFSLIGVTSICFFGMPAGITPLVGGIGVPNSMVERVCEIGFRKVFGATRGNIWMQFVIEQIVLTAIEFLFYR